MCRIPTALRILSALLVPLLSACVMKSTHEEVLSDLSRSMAGQEDLRAQQAELRSAMEEEERAHAREIAELRGQIERLEAEVQRLEGQRSEAEARFDEARTEVYRLETLLNERGSEFRRLQDRLRSLSALEREVRQRNEIYEEVIGRFQSLIDGGQLSVSIDRGRMIIQLPQDILFQSGSAVLAQDGRSTLQEVGSVLSDLGERQFQVEGHTDDVPISNERFPSNWELSTARALSVVRLLESEGVPPGNLSGAGYGEFQPRASNDTADGRRLNRRIEIVMLPNLDVIATTTLPD